MSRMTVAVRLGMPILVLVVAQIVVAEGPARAGEDSESLLRQYLAALDRMDAEGARAIAKRAAEQSGGPISELMTRHSRLLEATKHEATSKRAAQRAPRAAANRGLYTVTYNVADLVTPVSPLIIKADGSRDRTTEAGGDQPDFDGLMDLIESTVKPETWEVVGGPGTIRSFEPNLCIIVTQTQDVHEEITSLLEQLRRLQGVTVMLETRVVVVPEGSAPRLKTIARQDGTRGPQRSVQPPRKRMGAIDRREVQRLIDAASNKDEAATTRRVTLMNGQQVKMPVGGQPTGTWATTIQGVISSDFRFVRLTAVIDEQETVFSSVDKGKTMVVDLPQDQAKQAANGPAMRRLLLITPTILIAQEEEQRLGIEAVGRK